MKDELPSQPWNEESAIVNLNNKDQPGSHWVCYVKQGNQVRYFDSFGGVPPPLEISRYLSGCQISYNRLRHQRYSQQNCGQLCVRFLRGELRNNNNRRLI